MGKNLKNNIPMDLDGIIPTQQLFSVFSLRLRQRQALPRQWGIVDIATYDQSPHANFCALRLSYKTSDQCESAEDVESSVELNTLNSDLEPQTLKVWDLKVFWRRFECVGRRFAESPVIASKKNLNRILRVGSFTL